jgi:biopolymer transport protein ExbB
MAKILKRITASAIALCAFPTLAQAAEAAAPQAGQARMTLVEYYKAGGDLMHVLLAMSVFFVANVIYLFITLRASLTVPRVVFNDIMEKVRADKLEEAAKVCEYKPCPFSHIAASAISYALRAPVIDPMMLDATMNGEGARQAAKLNGRTQWLLDIASIAPMIGLLGTVIGMLMAFNGVVSVGAEVVQNKTAMLARGVSLALITTVAGLVIAIPAMGFYAWFRREAARQIANLECASSDLLGAMVSQFTRAN